MAETPLCLPWKAAVGYGYSLVPSQQTEHKSPAVFGSPSFLGLRHIVGDTLGGYVHIPLSSPHSPLSSPTMHLPTILPTRVVQGCWLGGAVDPFQAHPLVLSPPICVFPPGVLQLDQTSEPPDGWLKDRLWLHPPNF